MVKSIFIFLVFILCSQVLFAQKADSIEVDIIDVIIGRNKVKETDKIRSTRKVYFSLFPAAVQAPGGGKAVITAINAAFYMGDSKTTNLSNIYLIPVTDFSSRYGFYIRPNLWLNNNRWNFLGDYRIAHFPQYTWGLGGNTKESDESLIETDHIRVYQNALRRFEKNWYAGIGFAFDYHYNIRETQYENEGYLDSYVLPLKDPMVSSGVTFNVAYDSRKNPLNPARGNYLLFNWRLNTKGLGSDHNYQSVYLDGRKYVPFSNTRMNLLALRAYYWTVFKGDVPYLHLPATTWAPAPGIAGRGFQSGRFRSNAMIYCEAEHRYQLSRNGLFGMVVFANVASASEFQTQNFKYWHAGGGLGLRTKLNKFSGVNVAVDLAFSADYWSVWLNVGEMF